MDTTRRQQIMQRWQVVQQELLPELKESNVLSIRLEKLVQILEWVRIENFIASTHGNVGRPLSERSWIANAFIAKAVLNIPTTVGLIERLQIDRALRRICGFSLHKRLPSEATFSRAFDEFASARLAERVHKALVKSLLGDEIVGHLCRDGTAIEAREKPISKAESQDNCKAEAKPAKRKGRPRKDEVRQPKKEFSVMRQRSQGLGEMLAELPNQCDRGTKCNAQGYKVSWNGYKLHIDTADCGIPVSAILTSASVHDSRVAIPLSLLSAGRVTSLYDVMDAAYCSFDLQEHCRELNHVPLIDHNPRGGEKDNFDPADSERYKIRTIAERTNARLKDEFGGRQIYVRGNAKVMNHLMFGILTLSADQYIRLLH